MKNISILELEKILSDADPKTICLDVRTKDECQECSIKGTVNIPLDQLENHLQDLQDYDKVYVHCAGGGRASIACALLEKLPNTELFHLDGGIRAWKEAGLPTTS